MNKKREKMFEAAAWLKTILCWPTKMGTPTGKDLRFPIYVYKTFP